MSENAETNDVPDNVSVVSRSSRASTKPSGLRMPTATVSRLCQHAARKPSIPTTPDAKSECLINTTTMRSNEDFTKLTDVDEETETDLAMEHKYPRVSKSKSPESWRSKSTDRKVSNGSLGSDLYWEATGRRRSSADQSVILTHDTDSFIIGQRVWVGGIRPGHIQYIGETHFAPGEWAGVVLDEPNGKNDGCVSGKRYFQCEAKRGIFSRLTRLTREPLSGGPHDDTFRSMTTSPNRSGTVSPVPSSYSAYQNMVASTPRKSSSKANMAVGDRVIVSSGYGSRPGILMFLGETQFAPGTWCGIMLDDPTGKNDGTVDGIRYFECPDKFGIFVPLAKVTLSPSTRKTPSRLSRANSKESLTSIGTLGSMASTTVTSRLRMSSNQQKLTASARKPLTTPKNTFSLQEVLKEKQNHIEQLLKEKELDRQEADNQATILQKDINELTDKVKSLETSLQDEQLKAKNLQTAMEEIQFCNEELTIQAEEMIEKRTMIGDGLAPGAAHPEVNKKSDVELEKLRVELETQTLAHAELEAKKVEEVQKLREEVQAKSLANEELEKSNAAIKEEISELHLKLTELQNSLAHNISADQSLNDELGYLRAENETMKAELFSKDQALEGQFLSMKDIENTLQLKISELETNLEQMKDISGKDSESNIKLLDQVNEYTESLVAKDKEILAITTEHAEGQQEYLAKIEELKAELAKQKVETTEVKSANDKQLEEFSKFQEEMNTLQSNYSQREDELKKASSDISAKLKEIEEITKLSNNHSSRAETLEQELKEVRETYQKQVAEGSDLGKIVEGLNAEISQLKKSNSEMSEKLESETMKASTLSTDKESIASQLSQREEEVKQVNEQVASLTKELDTLKESHTKSASEIDQLKSQSDQLTQQLQSLNLTHEKAAKEWSIESESLKSNIHEVSAKLTATCQERDAVTHKLSDVEATIDQRDKNITELTATQTELKELLAQKDEHLVKTKKDMEEAHQHLETSKSTSLTLEATISQLTVDKEHLKTELTATHEKIDQLETQKKNLQVEVEEKWRTESTRDDMLSKLNDELQSKQQELEKSMASWSDSRTTFEKTKTELTQQIATYSSQIQRLREEMESLSSQRASTENELNVEIAKMRASNEELKRQHEESLKALQNKFKADRASVTAEITKKLDESEARKAELAASIVTLEKLVANLQSDLEAQKNEAAAKEKQFEEARIKLEGSCEEYVEANRKLMEQGVEVEKKSVELAEKVVIIARQEEAIEGLKRDAKELESVKTILEEKLNNSDVLLKKAEEQREEVQKNCDLLLSASQEKFDSLQEKLRELQMASSQSVNDQQAAFEEKMNALKAEAEKRLSEVEGQRDDLSNQLKDSFDQRAALEENMNSLKAETERKLSEMEGKRDDLSNQLKDSNDRFIELESQLQQLAADFKKQEDDLLVSKNLFTTTAETVTAKDEEIAGLKEGINNNSELIEKYKAEVAAAESAIQSQQSQFAATKLVITAKDEEISQLKSAIDALQNQLTNEVTAKSTLAQSMNDLMAKETNFESLEQQLQGRVSQLQLVEQERLKFVAENGILQETLSIQTKRIAELEKSSHKDESRLLTEVDTLKMEVEELRVANKSLLMTNNNHTPVNSAQSDDDDTSAQIKFLNSIIADMQAKNQSLMVRVQDLESTPKETPFAGFDQKVKRKPAPRVFCDICDVFDDHDTENCPVQSDSPPASLPTAAAATVTVPTPKHDSGKPRVVPPPRQYCTNCESFGHEADACDIPDCF